MREQRKLYQATLRTLQEIAREIKQGLTETVGVECEFEMSDRAAVVLKLAPAALGKYSARQIAEAVDRENIEAWCDEQNLVHVGINPWHTAKDTDQTVLAVIKVAHVLLGKHATAEDAARAQTFADKIKLRLHEVLQLLQPTQK